MSQFCSPTARRVHASGLHTGRCEHAYARPNLDLCHDTSPVGSTERRSDLDNTRHVPEVAMLPLINRPTVSTSIAVATTTVRLLFARTTITRKCAKVCEMPTGMTWCVHPDYAGQALLETLHNQNPTYITVVSFRGSLRPTRAVSSIS